MDDLKRALTGNDDETERAGGWSDNDAGARGADLGGGDLGSGLTGGTSGGGLLGGDDSGGGYADQTFPDTQVSDKTF